ncbi:hypothetical protein [Phenylobacterium sp.]|nr:hypothetical protein [Phenylobacterium sp.]
MPDIQNLKKQAKQLVRGYREGRHTVAADWWFAMRRQSAFGR